MSDDMDVVMDEDPLLPQVSRHPKGVGEALVINFFDRDPYTRRHRSRSMAEVTYPSPDNTAMATAVTNGGGVLSTASASVEHEHGGGVPRLTSAEV